MSKAWSFFDNFEDQQDGDQQDGEWFAINPY